MTGRELIIFIMQNGLEDKPVFENGALVGFMTEQQFAQRMNVGVATVKVWIDWGYIPDVVRVGDLTFIPLKYAEKHQYKGSDDNE